FGVVGFTHFGWYGRGFGRWYGFAPRYVTWGPRGYWGGGRWIAPHNVYPRVVPRYAVPHVPPHVVAPHAAPYFAPHAARYVAPHVGTPHVAPHAVGRGGFGGGHVAINGWHGGHR